MNNFSMVKSLIKHVWQLNVRKNDPRKLYNIQLNYIKLKSQKTYIKKWHHALLKNKEILGSHFIFLGSLKQTTTNWVTESRNLFFHILEARSLKSRCQWDHDPPETLGRILPCLSLVSGGGHQSWHSLACSCITPVSASVATRHSFLFSEWFHVVIWHSLPCVPVTLH